MSVTAWDAIYAFTAVLDTNSEPHDIRSATGLPEARCKEIESIYYVAAKLTYL